MLPKQVFKFVPKSSLLVHCPLQLTVHELDVALSFFNHEVFVGQTELVELFESEERNVVGGIVSHFVEHFFFISFKGKVDK